MARMEQSEAVMLSSLGKSIKAALRKGPVLVVALRLGAGAWEPLYAPIRSESREVVAAVGMDAHTSMIALVDFIEALGPHLVSTADQVSARLGYRREDERHNAGVALPETRIGP
jgi:hypothetical protein